MSETASADNRLYKNECSIWNNIKARETKGSGEKNNERHTPQYHKPSNGGGEGATLGNL